jgi:hypothetical protein
MNRTGGPADEENWMDATFATLERQLAERFGPAVPSPAGRFPPRTRVKLSAASRPSPRLADVYA